MSILLTSLSSVKRQALEQCLESAFEGHDFVSTDDCENVEQPVGVGGLICCKQRIEWTLTNSPVAKLARYVVSIENGIEKSQQGKCFDVVHIMIYCCKTKQYFYFRGGEIEFPSKYWDEAYLQSSHNELGWSVTVGKVLAKQLGTNPKNWIGSLSKLQETPLKYPDRVDQICAVLNACFYKVGTGEHQKYLIQDTLADRTRGNINYIRDFPKPGVLFQDLSPIFSNGELFRNLIKEIRRDLDDKNIKLQENDYVVGLESRGFIIGAALALEVGCGFTMIRKQGKLPPPTISAEYVKEYGTDIFEIQTDSLPSSARVLIIDDLLATGGSLECAVNLIRMLPEIKILACVTVSKVDSLEEKAMQKFQHLGVPMEVLLK